MVNLFKKLPLFVKIPIIIGLLIFAIWALSPLFYSKKIAERVEDIGNRTETVEEKLTEISKGIFTSGAPGHNGEGTAKLLKQGSKYFIRMEDDFKVTNGPDLFVYLGNNGQYDPDAQIARLKGNEGGQNYEIPANIDPTKYKEVWIWCKAFFVPFAKATWQ